MKIAVVIDASTLTIEQYDEMMDRVADRLADKSLMHFAHKHGNGVRIIEIWPSQEVFDEHVEFMKGMIAGAGLDFPEFEVVPVHRHFHKHHPHK